MQNLEGVKTDYRIVNLEPDELKNFGNVLGIKMTMGHGASMPKNYFKFLGDLGWNNQRINDLLGAKYILNKNPNNLKAPVKVKENPSALPIYRLYNKYEVVSQHNEAISLLTDEKFDYRSTIILNQQPDFQQLKNTGSSLQDLEQEEVLIQEQYPNQVKLLVKSKQQSILVFADQIYPGWSASVNDVKANIIEADTIFKAVAIPPGTSKVVFKYRPISFTIGLLLSGFAIFIYFLMSVKWLIH